MAQSSGPENIRAERPPPDLLAPRPVLSPSRITPEHNEKIRPQQDLENAFARAGGGRGGIRTHGAVSRPPVFKTGALNRSATLPEARLLRVPMRRVQRWAVDLRRQAFKGGRSPLGSPANQKKKRRG